MKGKILTAQEVQSILAGNKTMFREVIKPQPEEKIKGYFYLPNQTTGYCESLFVLDKCPYKVGEEIFVKESFWVNKKHGKFCWYDQDIFECGDSVMKKPAQHMKQEHSRLTLQIKSIGVERLGDISDEDARAEGFKTDYKILPHGIFKKDAIKFFIENWNATHKKPKEKFEANPWVWCINFEVVR